MSPEIDRLLNFAERLVLERVRRGDHATTGTPALVQWASALALDLCEALGSEINHRENQAERRCHLNQAVQDVVDFLRGTTARWASEAEIMSGVNLVGMLSYAEVLRELFERGLVEVRDSQDTNKRRLAEYQRVPVEKEYRLL